MRKIERNIFNINAFICRLMTIIQIHLMVSKEEREERERGGRERGGERDGFNPYCFFPSSYVVSLNRHHSGSSMSNTPAPSGGGASASGSLPPSVARSTSSSKVSHTHIN